MSRLHRVLLTCLKWALPITLVLNGLTYAQVQIPQLPAATLPLNGTEQILLQQNGVTKQTPSNSILPSFLSITSGNGITVAPNPLTSTGSINLTAPVTASNGGTGETGSITGIPKANGNGPFTTASSSDVPIPGSNTQVLFNNSGILGASSNFTWTGASNVLNLGASTTPGTFSVGVPDSMTVSGTALAVPGFSINSNIQGNIEAHSFATISANGSIMYGARSRGTISSPVAVVNGDNLLTLGGAGFDGTNYDWGAHIHFQVDGTPGLNVMPGGIDLQVVPAASNTPQTALFLHSNGSYGVNGSQGTSGQVLTSAGSGAAASWSTLPGSFSGFANPSGLIGLTAVNGAATTATRSDATPALDQSIAPTWTGAHTFSFNGIGVDHNSANPRERYLVTGATANQGVTLFVPTSTGIEYDSATDAAPTTAVTQLWKGTRTGSAWSNLTLGNATDNTTFTFAGTGGTTFGGTISMVFPSGTEPVLNTYRPSNGVGVGVGILRFDGNNSTPAQVSYARVQGQISSNTAGAEEGQLNLATVHAGTMTNEMTITNTSVQANVAAFRENYTSGSASFRVQNAGVDKGLFCVSITAGNCTTGDSVNDITLSTTGGALFLSTNSGTTVSIKIDASGTGAVHFPNVSTTASAANAFLDNAATNNLLRSTSSRRYKRDIKPLSEAEAEAIWKLQPISYHSKAAADDPKLKWYGLVAEDVAAVDPRLVQYDAQGRPDGVQYDRIPVLMLKELQEMHQEVLQLRKEVNRLKKQRGH